MTLIDDIRNHLATLPTHVKERFTARLLAQAFAELERVLVRGELTDDEFQNVCHNRPNAECEFKRGCVETWAKAGWNDNPHGAT